MYSAKLCKIVLIIGLIPAHLSASEEASYSSARGSEVRNFALYHQNLSNLYNKPISVQGLETLDDICPHLDNSARSELADRAKSLGSAYFALPAVLVKNSIHTAHLKHVKTSAESGESVFILSYGNSMNIGGNGFAKSMSSTGPLFVAEALGYANTNWRARLINDTWLSYGKLIFKDPQHVYEFSDELKAKSPWARSIAGTPKSKAIVYWVSTYKYSDIVKMYEEDEDWGPAIAKWTSDPIEGLELRGTRQPYESAACWSCGGALARESCPHCEHRFAYDPSIDLQSLPMPQGFNLKALKRERMQSK